MTTLTCRVCGTTTNCSPEDVDYTVHNEGWHMQDGEQCCGSCAAVLCKPDSIPATNITALKRILDIENRIFDIVLQHPQGWTVRIRDGFDTKEEAEYFVSLLKEFCK